MHIQVHIPRPVLTLGFIAGVVYVLHSSSALQGAVGGDSDPADTASLVQAEQTAQESRENLDVIARREEILRLQLSLIEDSVDPAAIAAREELSALLLDRQQSEQALIASLQEIRAAEAQADIASRTGGGIAPLHWVWPVEPLLGISAHFLDASYEEAIGMRHYAIDIPVEQGSPVAAAADGVVLAVNDRGMGFNSLIIQHGGGVTTLYGHVTEFLVEEGDYVRAGDIVALSGGRPGTKGAGNITTGDHLHFGVSINGKAVDPEQVLPAL